MFLFTSAIHLLPYTGAGSGMLRALSEDMKASFINNDRTNEFVITINRKDGNQADVNLDTKLRHSDTDLDTSDVNLDTRIRRPHVDLDTNLDTKRPKISNKQRDIINFCSVPRSSKEILERMGVTNHSKNRQTNIISLVEAGYLEMTNPEHPNASNQKYRKSKK